MGYIFYDLVCLCFSHVEFVSVTAVFPEKLHKRFYGKGVMLRGDAELYLATRRSRVSFFYKIGLVQDLSCISQEFITLLSETYSLFPAFEYGYAVFLLKLLY